MLEFVFTSGFYRMFNMITWPVICSSLLVLSHLEIESAIRQRYLKTGLNNKEVQMHQLLAGFCMLHADPDKNQTWKGSHPRAFAALPYHLVSKSCTINKM